eukprot:scaffold3667_cov376-Prasinococcus_capsulatus_cf.AAC.1
MFVGASAPFGRLRTRLMWCSTAHKGQNRLLLFRLLKGASSPFSASAAIGGVPPPISKRAPTRLQASSIRSGSNKPISFLTLPVGELALTGGVRVEGPSRLRPRPLVSLARPMGLLTMFLLGAIWLGSSCFGKATSSDMTRLLRAIADALLSGARARTSLGAAYISANMLQRQYVRGAQLSSAKKSRLSPSNTCTGPCRALV